MLYISGSFFLGLRQLLIPSLKLNNWLLLTILFSWMKARIQEANMKRVIIFIYSALGDTHGGAQGLLLTFCSGITPGCAWGDHIYCCGLYQVS